MKHKLYLLDFIAEPFIGKIGKDKNGKTVVLEQPAQYTLIKAGRRTGKTWNAVVWLLLKLLQKPNSSALWVDTNLTNIENYVVRYFKPILGDLWEFAKFNGKKYELKLANGSYIDFRSCTRPDMMEGFEYNYAILNEAGIILKNSDLWYQSVMPMVKNAETKIIGTPKGKNLFHTLFHAPSELYRSFSYSAYDSPQWTHEQLEHIKSSIPEIIWKGEYLAEFTDDGSSVFQNYQQCILPDDADDYVIDPSLEYVMGIDLAKSIDYTVIYVAEASTKRVIYQERFNSLDWNVQEGIILEAYKKFNEPFTLIDGTGMGGGFVLDNLYAKGMTNVKSFVFTKASKQDLINNLIVNIRAGDIFFYGWKELLHEIEVFEYEVSSDGHIRYNAPSGHHDDCVITLALVNRALYDLPAKIEFLDF